MAFFTKSLNSQLYVAPTTNSDTGFAAFLLPVIPTNPADGYSIAQALTDTTLRGSFILSADTPDLSTQTSTDALVKQLTALLNINRNIIWVVDFSNFSYKNSYFQSFANDGSKTTASLNIPLVSNIGMQVQSGMLLTATDNAIVYGSASISATQKIIFTGASAPDPNKTYTTLGSIPLTGAFRGTINFSVYISRGSLASGFTWGFQMLIPVTTTVNQSALAEYLPLAKDNQPSMTDAIGFNIYIDPTDVFNLAYDYTDTVGVTLTEQYNSRRTVFNFTGINQDASGTLLNSYYFTVWGSNVQLVPSITSTGGGLPARLVFNQGETYSASPQKSHLAPEGDFVFQVTGATAGTTYPVQCGLQGTEFFNVQSRTSTSAGDIMRFIGNQAAYAPVYPLPLSSPVTAPVKPNTPLLNTVYRTSYCTIVNGSSTLPTYVAQPKGSALFGTAIGNTGSKIIGHATPNFTFTANDTVLFPMLPYTGVVPDNTTSKTAMSKVQIEDLERLFISPTRKKNINTILVPSHQQAQLARKSSKMLTANLTSDADVTSTVSTPSGLIAGLSGATESNPTWEAIYLAQNQETSGAPFTKMYFSNPTSELVQAFQTSDLFLVIANNEHIGTAVNEGGTPDDTIAQFFNDMFIEDWTMQANTGTQNKYNNYNNIIIVKGRKGKLYDPDDIDNSLVANWQKWTDKDTFASPTTLDANGNLTGPDASQLVILSQWMQTYFQDASQQTDTAYFGNFNAIALDENWTGILILGMNIADLPKNLYGILSGVRYPDTFRAHHFGINITPIEQGTNGPEINYPSAMFGLIYYNDPDFNALNPQPIQPDLSATYDFVLLNLKVLFENTAVKSFQSYAQLTTNNYFGTPVDKMGDGGNTYNTLLLKGALQFKGDEAIYSLATDTSNVGANTFYFDSPVVTKVELTSVTFSTIGTNTDGKLVSLFSINGFWDFKYLSIPVSTDSAASEVNGTTGSSTAADDPTPFDILSFGNDDGLDAPRKGLIFNSLGIQMVSPPYVPGQTDPLPKTMTFDTSAMTFDQARSTPRTNSIYLNFALNLQSLSQGDKTTTPAGKDYLTVITDLKVSPIDGKAWVGLSYQLNMGTPGALAGNVGLTSTLLIAWDPAATTKSVSAAPVFVGIKLPGTGGGAPLISLQTVLKLSIGQIRLTYDAKSDHPAFLMMFTEIALQFLGLLKIPPNGSTLFYLFGNPQANGKASGLGWYAMYNQDAAT
jgi:hypothetical protein